jgi:hypothetical protein
MADDEGIDDPLLVRRYLHRPSNVDGAALSQETWPAQAWTTRTPPPDTSQPPNWPVQAWPSPTGPADAGQPGPGRNGPAQTGPANGWAAPIWAGQARPGPAHDWLAHDWQAETIAAQGWPGQDGPTDDLSGHDPLVHDWQPQTADTQDWGTRNWPGHDSPTETIVSVSESGSSGGDPPARSVPAHRANRPLPGKAIPSRRRRFLVIAGAAFAVLVALGGVGLAEFLTGDTHHATILGLPVGPTTPDARPGPPAGSASATSTGSAAPGSHSSAGATAQPLSTGDTAPAGVPPSPLAGPSSPGGSTDPLPPGTPALVFPSLPPDETAPASPAAAHPAGAIGGAGGLCLDLSGGATSAGTRVQVSTCNGGSTQRWTMAADGTAQVAGKCAQAASDGSVQVAACGGSIAAQWRAGSSRSLVNAATSKCLTDPAGGTRPGSAVTVATCTGATNQQWSLP